MFLEVFITGITQALILSLVAYGIMIPFRIINLPDLTSEGAYPFAGAISSFLILAHIPPLLSIVISAFAAGTLGIATGLIHLKLRVNSLLAGIIVSTMVYSISLKIMQKPNIALFNEITIFSNYNSAFEKIIILSIFVTIIIVALIIFLRTEIGLKLRAIGLNIDFAKQQNISINNYTIFGFFIASFCTGLSGSLLVQLQNYMDISMGIGIVIHALAALIIGESILNEKHHLFAPLLGSLIYQQIQGIALGFGFAPTDLKFLTGAIVLVVLSLNIKRNKII